MQIALCADRHWLPRLPLAEPAQDFEDSSSASEDLRHFDFDPACEGKPRELQVVKEKPRSAAAPGRVVLAVVILSGSGIHPPFK